jgi:ferredoxin-NADP reductase
VQGAFGRFSYVLHPNETHLVFIAGGIGITPFMSMIRHMHDTGNARDVLLLYANWTEKDIVFREELNRISASGCPRLTVVHVLSRPADTWQGPRGRIDAALLRQYCEVHDRAFYLCVPGGMYKTLIASLRAMGVPRHSIRYERFRL